MKDETWNSPDVRCLGVRLNGDAINDVDERGERIVGDSIVLLLNGGAESIPFVLPTAAGVERWETLVDTADPWQPARRLRAGDRYELQEHSMAVLRLSRRRSDAQRDHEWGPMGVL
jgi:glycogen operon protein